MSRSCNSPKRWRRVTSAAVTGEGPRESERGAWAFERLPRPTCAARPRAPARRRWPELCACVGLRSAVTIRNVGTVDTLKHACSSISRLQLRSGRSREECEEERACSSCGKRSRQHSQLGGRGQVHRAREGALDQEQRHGEADAAEDADDKQVLQRHARGPGRKAQLDAQL